MMSRTWGVGALLIGLLAPAASAHATFHGPNGEIAYQAGGETTIMRADGSNPRPLITPTGAIAPSLTGDGKYLLFRGADTRTSIFTIYSVTLQGTHHVREALAPVHGQPSKYIAAYNPTPSLDGKTVTFVCETYDGFDLCSVPIKAKRKRHGPPKPRHITQLTHCACADQTQIGMPTYSPDGRTIAFSSGYRLYTVPATGGTPTPILDPINSDGQDGNYEAPSWSPDGQWIAFANSGGPTGSSIEMARPDGSDRHVVLANYANSGTDKPLIFYSFPVFSPDGTRLLVATHTVNNPLQLQTAPIVGDGAVGAPDQTLLTLPADEFDPQPYWSTATGL